MRIEINLSQHVADMIKEKAEAVNHSRKSYIEFLCLRDIDKNLEPKDYLDAFRDNKVETDYLQALLDVADLFRLKLTKGTNYIGYLNDLITPEGLCIVYNEKLDKHFIELTKEFSKKLKK